MSPLHVFSSLKSPTHQRRRIIPLFVLGIVIPSVLLGLLAFRGIQNDRALLEKERLEANRRIADQVIREVDEKIRSVEAALTANDADLSDSAWQQFEIQHPLVEEVFMLRQPNGIDYPAAGLLYLPDDSKPPVSHVLMPSSGILAAQRLEFREKNYPKALAAYRQALKPDGDPQRRGEILNAVARVQKKSGLLREAAATYEHISQDYGRIYISDGIPLGPAARIERASLFADLNDIQSSASTLLDLYKSLLQPEWPLKKAQFEFFIAHVKKAIEDLRTDAGSGQDLAPIERNLQLLETEEKLKSNRTERAIAFRAGAGPALEAKLNDNGKGRSLRLTIDIDRYSYLVSIPKPETEGPERSKEVLGLILDAGELKNNILRPALLRIVATDGISWVVRDREGGSLLASDRAGMGSPAVQSDFVSRFPDWSLEIYQQPPNFVGAFLGTRHGIYSYMFLLIGGILIFGLALTIRTVSHELELAKMKSDLVSTISHEFKSPLAAIRQLAEMLHSGRIPSEDRRQKYYDILLEQSERLSLLTNNVLNLARIEEGRKEFFFQLADLGVLLQEAVSSMREQVGHEGFEIELDAGKGNVTARVDRESVFQAIANLLDNAVKYSGDSKHVSVRLATEDDEAVVTVRDSGIGIREEELGRVFERFYRCGDELTRTVRGTGLGLSLVKEIVEAHKGSVHVDSRPGKGSTFSIRLPLNRPEGS
jgi:signal transduction histidine kinase/tetratricopeptide (TPR) repeat protein